MRIRIKVGEKENREKTHFEPYEMLNDVKDPEKFGKKLISDYNRRPGVKKRAYLGAEVQDEGGNWTEWKRPVAKAPVEDPASCVFCGKIARGVNGAGDPVCLKCNDDKAADE